jgi:hypothetical protein
MAAKIHGGSGKRQGSRNYGARVRPSPVHDGSGSPKGALAPPRREVLNDANYASQKLKRK